MTKNEIINLLRNKADNLEARLHWSDYQEDKDEINYIEAMREAADIIEFENDNQQLYLDIEESKQ